MLVVILSCLLLLCALLAHGSRSLTSPAVLFTSSWSLLVLFALVFGSVYTYSADALAAMGALIACFIAGCLLVSSSRAAPHRTGPRPEGVPVEDRWRPKISRNAILLGALVGLFGAAVVSRTLGHSLLAFGSVGEFFAASQENAVSLYRGENAIPFVGKICFAVLQLACLASGAKLVLTKDQKIRWELIALGVAAVAWTLVTTQRTYVLVPAVWWLSGYVAASTYVGGSRRLKPRSVLLAAVGATAFGAAILAVRLVRTGSSASSASGLIDSSRPWLAGYIPAFSSTYSRSTGESGSALTGLLQGVRALIGQGSDQLSGGYENIGNGDSSNAGTILRFFLAGGDVLTAGVYLFALGCLCQFAYRRARNGYPLGAVAYAACIAGILWSPNSWFYGYGGRILAAILAGGLVFVSMKRSMGRAEHATEPPVAQLT